MSAVTGKNVRKKNDAGGGRTVTFQPTDEVRELLIRAKAAGMEVTTIINEALAERGMEIAQRMAKDAFSRVSEFKTYTDRRK